MNSAARPDESGFTLVEVLVSLAILGVSLAVLLNAFSGGLDRARDTKDEMTASMLAQSLLDQIGTTVALREGDTSGQFDNGYSWQIRSAPYGTYDDRQAWRANPMMVTVTVRWDDGAPPHALTLTTLRLAPPESQP